MKFSSSILLSKKQKIYFFGLSFLSAISALLEIIGISLVPLIVTAIVDVDLFKVIIKKISFVELDIDNISQEKVLYIMTIGVILIFLIKNSFLLFVGFLEQYFNYVLIKSNSERLYENYLNQDYSFHTDRNSAILTKNVTQEIRSAISFLSTILILFRESLIFLLICILLIINSPREFLLIFTILSLFLIFFYLFFNKRLKERGEKFFHSRNNLLFIIEQSFGFIKEIIIFKKKNLFFNRFTQYIKETEFQGVYLNTVNKAPRILFELIAVFICLAIIYYFFYNSRDQLIPIISLYGISMIRLIPSFSTILTSFLGMKFHLVSFQFISNELKRNYRNKENILEKDNNKNYALNKKSKLIIDNMSFRYEGTNKEILNNINLSLNFGNVIGVLGASGSGKSTFGDLVMGLYLPTKGKLCLDSQNINDYPYNWKKLIGYLSQDVFLLDDSIRKNIAITNNLNEIDNQLINEVVEKSNSRKFIEEFTNKLDTQVGERGVKLSGGQKQRIGIARILYHNPKIFIFDEPTSGLDEANEKKIINTICNLKKENTLVFLITHKISNLSKVDNILFIKDKKISIYENNPETIEFIKKNY